MMMPSSMSKIIYKALKRSKLNTKLAQEIKTNQLEAHPQKKPSKHMMKKYHIEVKSFFNQSVYYMNYHQDLNQTIIYYLHGGAYVHGLSNMHYRLFKKLMKHTGCVMVVPDYPLVPKASVDDIYRFLETAYLDLVKTYPKSKVILMGDSAGGGLALGLSIELYQKYQIKNHELLLLSPWLDVSMENPKILDIQPHDPILNQETLLQVGKMYARELSLKDTRLSPLYGSFEGIKKVDLWTGTNDILCADALKLEEKLKKHQQKLKIHTYEDMLHTWMFFGIPESKQAINEMIDVIHQSKEHSK
jgi:epsilon-lactone hydrolase